MLPIWLVLLGCLPLQGSEVRVHQPPELRASLGGSVLLNCTFSAAPKASKLAVTWVRSTSGRSGEVQIYPPPRQVTELRSRVALDSGRFRHQRDASLHLANLTQHDAGLYRCFIWTSATSSHAGNGTELSVLGEGPGAWDVRRLFGNPGAQQLSLPQEGIEQTVHRLHVGDAIPATATQPRRMVQGLRPAPLAPTSHSPSTTRPPLVVCSLQRSLSLPGN
uniref:Ig-like domain-containing protein n=1 Tax=Terrapene triunguis TaxID=2587831 RepID=A0A674IC94_9SAUR